MIREAALVPLPVRTMRRRTNLLRVHAAVHAGALSFVGLSAYTYMNPCNHDFASWGTGLFVMLWGLIIGGIFISIFGTSQLSSKILCVVGILVFMAYICYDTWQMSERMQPGDECVAALELYLDIINLVTYIMSLLSKK